MGLEDKYVPIKEVEYKYKKIVLPRTVYIKESYIKEQDKVGAMKAVFDQLIEDPELLFKLIKFMCDSKEKVSMPIPISMNSEYGTVWTGYIRED